MIFSGARILLVSALALALSGFAGPAAAGKVRGKSKEDLINVMLRPGLAQWLVGPIGHIATKDEIRAYLSLTDDQAADAFIDSFWKKRIDPGRTWPERQLREVFEERAKEADRLYTEGVYVGRRTDRGATYVLFGAPRKKTYVQEQNPRKTTVEIWSYGNKPEPGLNGTRPRSEYFFARKGDLTVSTQRPRAAGLTPRRRVP